MFPTLARNLRDRSRSCRPGCNADVFVSRFDFAEHRRVRRGYFVESAIDRSNCNPDGVLLRKDGFELAPNDLPRGSGQLGQICPADWRSITSEHFQRISAFPYRIKILLEGIEFWVKQFDRRDGPSCLD